MSGSFDVGTCSHDSTNRVTLQAIENLGFHAPDVHFSAEQMALVAQEVRRLRGSSACCLPLCETVEAEALGAQTNMGSATEMPRPGAPVLSSYEDCLGLQPIDFRTGRIAQVLDAIEILSSQGEVVRVSIMGPFSIINALTDVSGAFKALRKNPDTLREVLATISRQTFRFVDEAQRRGAHAFCFADAVCAPHILGPKMTARVTELFTASFVAELFGHLDEDSQLFLCPMTTKALLDSGINEVCGVDILGTGKINGRTCPHKELGK